MKRFYSIINCVHFYAGLFFLGLAVWCVWWIFHLFEVDDKIGLSIMYTVVLVIAILGCLVEAFERFKKTYKFVKENTNQS